MPLRLWLPLAAQALTLRALTTQSLTTQALTLPALPTQALPMQALTALALTTLALTTQALTALAPRAPGQNRDHENHPIARGQRALAAATPSMGVCRLRRAWQRRQWRDGAGGVAQRAVSGLGRVQPAIGISGAGLEF